MAKRPRRKWLASRRRTASRHVAQLAQRSGTLSLFRTSACLADRLGRVLDLDGPWRRGGLVFMFHRITEQTDPFRPGFELPLFEQFCQHVAEHYDVLPLHELELRRVAGRALARCIAITFDDGYLDNYRLAFPLLKKYGLPATVFVATGAVRGGKPLWTSRVSWIMEHARASKAPECFADRPLRLDTKTQRATTAHELVDRLRLFDAMRRDALLDDLACALQVDDFTGLDAETVSWDELREMDRGGFAAQPHTVTHPILSLMPSDQIEDEIARSKVDIECQLNRPAAFFAYPRGTLDDFDQRAVDIVRRLGFKAAYSTVFAATQQRDDPFRLPRVCIYGDTPAEMMLQMERFFYLRTSHL